MHHNDNAEWPAGSTMRIECPNCNSPIDTQISVARDMRCASRPEDCDHCGAHLDVDAGGSVTVLMAPSKVVGLRGRELLEARVTFDPQTLTLTGWPP